MSEENRRTIQSMYDAFGRGDIPALLGVMDPDIEWWEAESFIYADGNPYIGPQAVLAGVFARIGAEWEGFTVSLDEILEAGDTLVARGYYSGRYRKTGRDVRAQFVHVWKLRNGRPVKFQQYTDTAQFKAAVG